MQPLERILPESWRVTVLRLPPGYYGARAAGRYLDQVAGSVESAGNRWAGCLWPDDAPAKMGADKKLQFEIHAARGAQLAGVRKSSRGKTEAFLWQPAADGGLEAIRLHPRGYSESAAVGCDGIWQAGHGLRQDGRRALLWQGQGPAPVELPDPRAEDARAAAVCDGAVVGSAGWPSRALLWPDGPSGAIELHPRGFACSAASGVGDGQQAGWVAATEAIWAAGNSVPAVWSGSAASMSRLLPQGFTAGQAYDCCGGLQVGVIRSADRHTGFRRAALWGGSAAAFLDLHAKLGAPWTDSSARWIEAVGRKLTILGEAWLMSPDRRGIAGKQIVRWEAALTGETHRTPEPEHDVDGLEVELED
jgi:hypothetical protein